MYFRKENNLVEFEIYVKYIFNYVNLKLLIKRLKVLRIGFKKNLENFS